MRWTEYNLIIGIGKTMRYNANGLVYCRLIIHIMLQQFWVKLVYRCLIIHIMLQQFWDGWINLSFW